MLGKWIYSSALLLAAIAALSACSGGSGSLNGASNGLNVTISGSISAASFVEPMSGEFSPLMKSDFTDENGTMAVTLGDLEIYVIYFSGSNVGVKQAAVNAVTGAWTFDIPQGAQISAIVRNKTSTELVGPITFVDSTQKDMSGKDKETTSVGFKAGASVGTIQLASDGKFKVDANLPSVAAAKDVAPPSAASSSVDFTGAWTLKKYTGILPTGYTTACIPALMGGGECNGPTDGEKVYFVKMGGKKFTPNSSCATYKSTDGASGHCDVTDGTVGTEDLYAAQVWGGGAAVEACGFKTGFLASDARAFANIHFDPANMPMISGAGITTPTKMALAKVTFSVATGFGGDSGAGNQQPWMKNGATSDYDIMKCRNVHKSVSGKEFDLNVCSGTLTNSSAGYQANGPGGCVTSAGTPVVIKDWSAINGATPDCGNGPTAHPNLPGMFVSSCRYTGVNGAAASEPNFTCTNTSGTFTDANATTAVAGGVFIQTFDKITAGSLCRSITDDLEKYKCYANAYFKAGNDHVGSGCGVEYRFNWQAGSAAEFVVKDGSRDKPKNQYLTSLVQYSADGGSFVLEDAQQESVSVQTGRTSIPCRVERKMILKGTSLSTTQLLVDLTQDSHLMDTTNATCVGEKNNATANSGRGTELYQRVNSDNGRFLFTLNK